MAETFLQVQNPAYTSCCVFFESFIDWGALPDRFRYFYWFWSKAKVVTSIKQGGTSNGLFQYNSFRFRNYLNKQQSRFPLRFLIIWTLSKSILGTAPDGRIHETNSPPLLFHSPLFDNSAKQYIALGSWSQQIFQITSSMTSALMQQKLRGLL